MRQESRSEAGTFCVTNFQVIRSKKKLESATPLTCCLRECPVVKLRRNVRMGGTAGLEVRLSVKFRAEMR